MKRFRVMAAALCAAVLLCGFSVPAYAYADGGEGADYGDPTMTEETPAPEPEPTIEPGEGFSEEGNLVTRDLLYDEHTNKQFITVQTAGGNTFYIVIDYDKPVDEEGEQYETYFFSVVDEADLLAAAEAAGVEQAVCSCSEKCAAGAVNTECAVCSVNMEKCVGVEPEPVETEEPAPEEAEPETGGNMGMLLAVLAVALVGGGAAFYFKVLRPKQQKAAEPQEDYGDELPDYDGPDGYGDEDDDGPPQNSPRKALIQAGFKGPNCQRSSPAFSAYIPSAGGGGLSLHRPPSSTPAADPGEQARRRPGRP